MSKCLNRIFPLTERLSDFESDINSEEKFCDLFLFVLCFWIVTTHQSTAHCKGKLLRVIMNHSKLTHYNYVNYCAILSLIEIIFYKFYYFRNLGSVWLKKWKQIDLLIILLFKEFPKYGDYKPNFRKALYIFKLYEFLIRFILAKEYLSSLRNQH